MNYAFAPADADLASLRPDLSAVPGQWRAAFWALALLTLAGWGARLMVDEQLGNAPVAAAIMLLSGLALAQASFGAPIGLLAFLMMPALFSAAPWDSPVHAYVGAARFPIYVFDGVLVLSSAAALAGALLDSATPAARFVRAHWLPLMLVGAGLLVKVAAGGMSGEVLRNAAVFYYFPCICLAGAAIARRIDFKRVLPYVYLRSLIFAAFAPAVVLVGIAVGARDTVLEGSHQGVGPAGILAWLPPGSLLLLSFCAAAFLFDRGTPLLWKAVIVLLLAFDALSYWNRAMWFGLACGIACHWAIVRGWWRGVLPACAALAAVTLITPTIEDSLRQEHNESSEWRLLIWALAAGQIAEQPLVGHSYGESLLDQLVSGPESQQAMADASIRIDAQARSPHNSYLSLLFFGGVVQGGAVIFFILGTLISLGRAVVRLRRLGLQSATGEAVFRGAVAVSVYAAFNVVLESPVEGITYWMILYCAWLWREDALERLRALKGLPANAIGDGSSHAFRAAL